MFFDSHSFRLAKNNALQIFMAMVIKLKRSIRREKGLSNKQLFHMPDAAFIVARFDYCTFDLCVLICVAFMARSHYKNREYLQFPQSRYDRTRRFKSSGRSTECPLGFRLLDTTDSNSPHPTSRGDLISVKRDREVK